MEFFNETNIKECADGIKKEYRKNLYNSKYVKNLKSVYDKTNWWADSISNELDNFEVHHDTTWQISRHYKKYTWARLYPKDYKRHLIYYTIGVDFNDRKLVWKIDCQRKGGNRLLKYQVDKFDEYLEAKGKKLYYKEIKIDSLNERYSNDWSYLLEQTKSFIDDTLSEYYNLINVVWGIEKPSKSERGISLEELLKRNERNREQGDEAEEFVLKFEKNRLKKHTRVDRVEIISKHYANAGYDIKSFHNTTSKQRKKLIEVKSYIGKPHFYWSSNEKDIAMLNRDHYFIYLVDHSKIKEKGYIPEIFQNPYETIYTNEEWDKTVKSTFLTKKM